MSTDFKRNDDREIIILQQQMTNVIKSMDDLKDELGIKIDALAVRLESKYVTKEEFSPVKTLVYGGTGLALVALVGAILHQVIKNE